MIASKANPHVERGQIGKREVMDNEPDGIVAEGEGGIGLRLDLARRRTRDFLRTLRAGIGGGGVVPLSIALVYIK